MEAIINGTMFKTKPEQLREDCFGCAVNVHPDYCAVLYQECDGCKGVIWDYAPVQPQTDEQPLTAMDKQVGGNHYKKTIQPWTVIDAWNLNFWEGNAVKYISRHKEKAKKQDIEKAIHYLEYIRDNYETLYPE
jgi:hypothetical protein